MRETLVVLLRLDGKGVNGLIKLNEPSGIKSCFSELTVMTQLL
jgi:hypothetical protein